MENFSSSREREFVWFLKLLQRSNIVFPSESCSRIGLSHVTVHTGSEAQGDTHQQTIKRVTHGPLQIQIRLGLYFFGQGSPILIRLGLNVKSPFEL